MASRRPIRLATFAAAAALVGVACGGSSDGADESTSTQDAAEVAPETSPQSAGDSGDAAPESGPSSGEAPEILQFTGNLVGGGELQAAELSGKPTAFWFWSPT